MADGWLRIWSKLVIEFPLECDLRFLCTGDAGNCFVRGLLSLLLAATTSDASSSITKRYS